MARSPTRLLVGLAGSLAIMLASGPAAKAQAAAQQQYAVVYGELAPNFTARRDGALLLGRLTQVAQTYAGFQQFTVNQEIGRPNFFTLIVIWRDAASYAAFTTASSTQEVLSYLQPLLLAPLDERDGNLVLQ